MRVYLDESGDLGWNFTRPYRQGGSSRYLSIGFLFLPDKYIKLPKKIIKKLYRKYNWKNEKKASYSSPSQKMLFCNKAKSLLEKHSDIKIAVITASKINVQSHIKEDPNKLYNYMTRLIVPEYIKKEDSIEFIPDERSVKVKSGNSLADYLQTIMWFDYNAKTKIINRPGVSKNIYNIQFIDWIVNCIWSSYENNDSEPYNIIAPIIDRRELYF